MKAKLLPVLIALLILPVPAAEQSVPERVFGQEKALLAEGRLAERVALDQGVYIVQVTEVHAPEMTRFEERGPLSFEEESPLLDIWDYTQLYVRGEVVGSEEPALDCRLYFGRDFTSRSTGVRLASPDDGFPDPKVGDRLLVFYVGMKYGNDASPPLWTGDAHQANSMVVMDGGGHCTVCVSGHLVNRGSNAFPL